MFNQHSEITPIKPSAGIATFTTATPSSPAAPTPPTDVDARQLWKTIVRRRNLLFAVWAGFALVVAIATILTPKQYTTQVKMIAGSTNASPGAGTGDNTTNLPILNALMAANGAQTSETYAELLQQSPIAEEVARRVGLNVGPTELGKHLLVRPVTDTAILVLNVTWRNPKTSAAIANAYADVFIDHERQLVAHQADSALTFLRQQLPQAEEKMRETQDALATYQQQTGIADLPTQMANNIAALGAMDLKMQTEQLDAAQAQAQLNSVRRELASTPPTVVGNQTVSQNPVAAQLQQQVSTLTAQLATAQQQYTDDYPAVISLKSQLAGAKRQLAALPPTVTSGTSSVPNPVYQQLTQTAATLQATIASAQTQVATIRRQRAGEQPKFDSLPAESRRIGDLQRAEKSAQGLYEAMQQKYQDAMLSKTTAISDVSITQAADPTVYTSSPKVPFNIALGIFVGLILALSAVFAVEFFDDRFRTEDDVRERLGLPVLASIPLVDASNREEWVKPLSIESFYQLVASLRYSSAKPPRTITFTSADQGDGKSSIAMNTAISMGLMNARVLVIDADLRRPTIHDKFGLTNERGLSDVLVGLSRFQDAVVPTEHKRVFVLPSGRSAPNPVSLLQSEAFDRLLAQAREQYDFVLIDCPALRSIVDGVVLSIKAEGTVLVVSATQSDNRGVRAALARLRAVGGINLIGVVLNATRPNRRDTAADYYLASSDSVALPPATP